MKVKELIEHLQHQDQEADVHFAYLAGSTWLAPKAQGVFISKVIWSFIHDSPKLAENLSETSLAKDALVLMP